MVFGLAAKNFHIRLPGWVSEVKKPLPAWFGRLWFIGFGALHVYLGIRP
jgi:hypothetical protein